MKTSNIIILSTIGFVFFMNIWIVADVKNKFYAQVQDVTVYGNKVDKKISLGDFKHIVLSDNSSIYIQNSGSNSYFNLSKKEQHLKIINDTLYISEGTDIVLNCKDLVSIQTIDESVINIQKYEAEYLKVVADNQSKFIAENQILNKLDIYAKEQARIIINNSTIDTANILATDFSTIGLRGNLEIVRGEVKDNSNLSVSGANNTQFSKSGDASINMY